MAGHDVVVKALPSYAISDAVAKASFQLASRTAAAISHPGAAQVYHCGHAFLPAGQTVPYLVRDLVSGPTLAERLAEGAMAVDEALTVVAAIADILAATHRAGLVHGHLVPENVVLSPPGVKVTDFGLWASSERPEQALVAVLAPYACYTAPEQLSGGPVTPATDMYSLGAIFAACLTGTGGRPRTGLFTPNCVAGGRKSAASTPNCVVRGPGSGVSAPNCVAGGPGSGVSAPNCVAGGAGNGVSAPNCVAGGAGNGVSTPSCVPGVPGTGLSRFADLSAKVGVGVASLWAACLAANPGVRPSAAHAAVMSRQIIPGALTDAVAGATTAASSRRAGPPAVPATG